MLCLSYKLGYELSLKSNKLLRYSSQGVFRITRIWLHRKNKCNQNTAFPIFKRDKTLGSSNFCNVHKKLKKSKTPQGFCHEAFIFSFFPLTAITLWLLDPRKGKVVVASSWTNGPSTSRSVSRSRVCQSVLSLAIMSS